jgi:hypothetical protein
MEIPYLFLSVVFKADTTTRKISTSVSNKLLKLGELGVAGNCVGGRGLPRRLGGQNREKKLVPKSRIHLSQLFLHGIKINISCSILKSGSEFNKFERRSEGGGGGIGQHGERRAHRATDLTQLEYKNNDYIQGVTTKECSNNHTTITMKFGRTLFYVTPHISKR